MPFQIFRRVRLGEQPSKMLQVFLMDKAIHGGLPLGRVSAHHNWDQNCCLFEIGHQRGKFFCCFLADGASTAKRNFQRTIKNLVAAKVTRFSSRDPTPRYFLRWEIVAPLTDFGKFVVANINPLIL